MQPMQNSLRHAQVCMHAPALAHWLTELDPGLGGDAAANGGPPADVPAFLQHPEGLEVCLS